MQKPTSHTMGWKRNLNLQQEHMELQLKNQHTFRIHQATTSRKLLIIHQNQNKFKKH